MNARDWLVANKGKQVRLVRKYLGNKIRNTPAIPEIDETIEGELGAVRIAKFGWSIRLAESSIFCFSLDHSGESQGNNAIIDYDDGSGDIFRHEFTLLE